MNGFAYFCENSLAPSDGLARIVPPDSRASYEHRTCLPGEFLLTWGGAGGDIHHIASGQDSFLVLSGYLLGTKSGIQFSDQNQAAEWCLGKINDEKLDEALENELSGLRGSYAIFYRSRRRGLTLCISDRIASRPLWRQWRGSGWIVSSHPTAIALSAASARLDATALGSLLVYGGPVDPCRSLFEDVRGTPPGTIVVLDARGVHRERRWYSFQHKPDEHLTLTGWVDLTADRLVTAASRLLRDDNGIAVFFSGGTDSRLAAAALKTAGGDPLLVTLADSDNLEVKTARLAAKALGLSHKVILRDKLWYLRSLSRAVYETGGSYSWTHGHFSSAAQSVAKETGIQNFVLGDLCEAFSKLCCSVGQAGNEPWSPDEFTEAFDTLRLPLYRPADKNVTLGLLNAKLRKEVENGLRIEIGEQYRRILPVSRDPLIIGDQCLRWESIQTIPTFFMFLDLRSAVQDRNIMFDADVHGLLERLPARFRNERNLGARVIDRLQPRAARVRNSNSMLPMIWPPFAHRTTRRVKPILGRVRRSLSGNTYSTTGSWPKSALLYRNDSDWRREFDAMLNQCDLFDKDLFDRDAIRKCWQEFLAGNDGRAEDVERLVQISILSEMLNFGS